MLLKDYGERGGGIEGSIEAHQCYLHLARLWAVRILEAMGRPRPGAYVDGDLLVDLGLAPAEAGCTEATEVLADRPAVAACRAALERREWKPLGPLADNLEFLARRFGLETADCAAVAFLVLAERFSWLDDLVRLASESSRLSSAAACLAVATGIDEAAARTALGLDGRLYATGFFSERGQPVISGACLPSLVDELAQGLLSEDFGEDFLQDGCVRTAPPPRCRIEGLEAGAPELGTVREVVRSMLGAASPPGQILLHGRPGIGKTEFARALAEKLEVKLFEVRESEHVKSLGPGARLQGFLMAQALLANRDRCLLLFDEADQVLAWSEKASRRDCEGWDKAWLNGILESARVPCIWIANEIGDVHPAILRRFRVVTEMPVPNTESLVGIYREQLQDVAVRAEWLHAVARTGRVTPGLMRNAAEVARGLDGADAERVEQTMGRVLEGHCRAARERRFRAPDLRRGRRDALPYRVEWLNTEPDVAPLVGRLARATDGDARLLFSGPPGTGKTALAGHLAEAAGRELIVGRASKILDCYVGGTEKNLARLFERAAADRAVLLLDEADGFLGARAGARARWEVTQVNELLTQLERFDGVFIAATNRAEGLDPAALRRLDVKVRFGYLRPGAVTAMFRAVLGRRGRLTRRVQARLDKLGYLTPGDFQTVVRRLRALGEPLEPDRLLEALEQEMDAKPDIARRTIGFTAKVA